MNMKKIFAIASVLMMCFAPMILCTSESSATGYEEKSMTDAVFSRATITYLKGVSYGEHMDRDDCWFFVDGSVNENIFVKYVTKQSSEVPSSDDKEELNNKVKSDPTTKCNIYNVGINPKFTANAPLLTIDYVHVVANKGQRLTVTMTCNITDGYAIKSTTSSSSELVHWSCGKQYMTTAEEDNVSYDIMPNNAMLYGDKLDMKDLFAEVSYDVSVSSGTEFNGNNVTLAVILFILGAAVIAVIVLCSRKIAWAKGAADPEIIPENDGTIDNGDKK